MFPVLLNPINSFAVKFLFVLLRISTVNNLLSRTVEYSYQAANTASGSAVLPSSNRFTLNRSKLVKRRTDISFSGSTVIGSVPINALARMRHLRWAVLLFFPSRISFELFSDIFHPFRRVPSNARLPPRDGIGLELVLRKVRASRGEGENARTIVTCEPNVYPLHRRATRPIRSFVPHFSPPFLFFFPSPPLSSRWKFAGDGTSGEAGTLASFCSVSGRVNEDEREETRAETKSAKPTSNSRHADTERSPRPFHACAHPSVPVLSAFHSAQLHPADTLSPLSSPAPPLSPRRPLLVAPTPPPLRLITTLIHHHRGDLFSLFSFFVPILFLYPRISFSFPLLLSFILSFLSSRKERKLSSLFHLLLSLSRTFQHILFFSPFVLLLNPFSDFEGSIQCSRYSNSSQRVEYIVWKSDGAMCSTTLCPDTTYRGYDKRDAIRGAIPENWEIIPEAKNWNDRIEEKIDTRTFRSISRACIRWSFIETVFIFPLFLFRTNITELYKNCLKHSISRREYSWLRFLTVFFRYFPIYNKKSIKSIEASLVRVNSRKGIYIYLDRGSIQCGKMSIRVVWSILFSSPATDPIYLKRDKTFNGIIT